MASRLRCLMGGFVGRYDACGVSISESLVQLCVFMQHLLNGNWQVMLVEGLPGSGKTTAIIIQGRARLQAKYGTNSVLCMTTRGIVARLGNSSTIAHSLDEQGWLDEERGQRADSMEKVRLAKYILYDEAQELSQKTVQVGISTCI